MYMHTCSTPAPTHVEATMATAFRVVGQGGTVTIAATRIMERGEEVEEGEVEEEEREGCGDTGKTLV